jgi:hypothetical protein
MPSMPTREALRALYDTAIREIDQSREEPRLTTGFYAQIGDAVFEAAYSALEDFCTPEPDRPAVPRLHVVSTPVGSGKTSFSLALITALTRLANVSKDAPHGCVFLVEQIAKAEEMYVELSKLLPGQVAIWTADHDKGCKSGTKVKNPTARHDVNELADYPVAIVTHAFYSGKRGEKAKHLMRDGQLLRRALTIVDEHPNQVTVYDIQLSQAEAAREHVVSDEERSATIEPHLAALVSFMRARADAERASSLEKPSDDYEAWRTAKNLEWFATTEAQEYANADPKLAEVFGFARAMAKGYAFIARDRGGEGGTHFIGYESKLIRGHGAMLLDATADIDGVTQLCHWREPPRTAQARYDNLSIVHVPQPTQQRLSVFLKTRKNHTAYVRWMESVIKDHMRPDQCGLVVCKKVLFDFESVPNWPQGDERFSDRKLFSERYGWELDGRHLCAIHWGTGIGDNAWKDADVVFLFDEFHVPRRSVIATAQGLQGHKATQGALASMRSQNAKAPAVELLSEGRLLRWNKQMALRGRARCFDEHGVCGEQKLICSGDRDRLLLNYARLFPGARLSLVTDSTDQQTTLDRLYEVLARQEVPEMITTSWLSQQMKLRWRDVRKNIRSLESFERSIAGLGWSYVPKAGRGGGCFTRRSLRQPQPV